MNCICCGHEVETLVQGTKPQKIEGHVVWTDSMELYTCQNEACKLWMQTFSEYSYRTRADQILRDYQKAARGA